MAVRPAPACGVVLPILSASVRLYGALLALYPKAFRRSYEALQRRQVLRGMLRGDRIQDDLRSLGFELEVPDRG